MGIEDNLDAAVSEYERLRSYFADRGVLPADAPGVIALAALMANKIDLGELAKQIAKELNPAQGNIPSEPDKKPVIPYTVVECSLSSDCNLEVDADELENFTDYLTKHGWTPDKFWMRGGQRRNDFDGVLAISEEDLDDLAEDDEATIRVYYTRENEGFCLEYLPSGEDPGFAFRLTSYHPDLKQGFHDINDFGEHDKESLVKLVNEMIEVAATDGYTFCNEEVSLVETGDRYGKNEVEEDEK